MIAASNWKLYALGAGLVLAIGFWIYNKGKAAGQECSWWDKLMGNCPDDENRKTYVPTGPGAPWTAQRVTNRLYNAIHGHTWYSPNGEDINNAFYAFNSLNDNQKFKIVNDWEERIKGKDKTGWGTGNYPGLRATLEEFDEMQPQVDIAYQWLSNNQM